MTVSVVQFFLVVAAGMIEVDDNDNGTFSVRRGLEVEAYVLGGDSQVTINRYVRRVPVGASPLIYMATTGGDGQRYCFLIITDTYA